MARAKAENGENVLESAAHDDGAARNHAEKTKPRRELVSSQM